MPSVVPLVELLDCVPFCACNAANKLCANAEMACWVDSVLDEEPVDVLLVDVVPEVAVVPDVDDVDELALRDASA